MQDATTVLQIIHERGKRGLPLENAYRLLYNPRLYLRAYEHLRTNKGAMTPGITAETVDSMSLEKIRKIIEQLKQEKFRWTPVRRMYIPKKNGKMRPLGLPTFTDKLVQEVMRSILEAYYDPQFSRQSHGFRPNHGCHTALQTVQQTWTGTTWFIEGDISKCFDNLDHTILLSTMKEKIHDNRFMLLVERLLKAGYLEDWEYHKTYSGSPQGGVISPILSNIYLDKLDKHMEEVVLPHYNRGERHSSLTYTRLGHEISAARKAGDTQRVHTLTQQRRLLPSQITDDPTYRRLRYIRYADDFLLGWTGPKAEAEEIKAHLKCYLAEHLHLELSEEKTLITHARTDAAHFLGYDLRTMHADDKLMTDRHGRHLRSINGRITLRTPQRVIAAACARHERNGKPIHRSELTHHSDYHIVRLFQSEYRGLVQYYLLASNVSHLSKVRWITETALLKTLANKHGSTVNAMVKKYKAQKDTAHGTYTCLRVVVPREGKPPLVAEFGGIPLRRNPRAELVDKPLTFHRGRTDLLTRLLADTCELCGDKGNCEAHHVRRLADLKKPGKKPLPMWKQHMIAMRRKTLIVCVPCHRAIEAGRPTRQRPVESVTGEPDAMKVASPVRRGADGKGA